MSRLVTAATGSVALIIGFAVAQATGIRWLGGIVLIAGAVWCGRAWWRANGLVRAVGVVLIFGIAFIASHPLGHLIGPWPSVFLVAIAAGALAYALTPAAA